MANKREMFTTALILSCLLASYLSTCYGHLYGYWGCLNFRRQVFEEQIYFGS